MKISQWQRTTADTLRNLRCKCYISSYAARKLIWFNFKAFQSEGFSVTEMLLECVLTSIHSPFQCTLKSDKIHWVLFTSKPSWQIKQPLQETCNSSLLMSIARLLCDRKHLSREYPAEHFILPGICFCEISLNKCNVPIVEPIGKEQVHEQLGTNMGEPADRCACGLNAIFNDSTIGKGQACKPLA